jgi:hypothetical protein
VFVLKRFPSLLAVGSGVHVEAGTGQNAGYEAADVFFVVCDENSLHMYRDRRLETIRSVGSIVQRRELASLKFHKVALYDLFD